MDELLRRDGYLDALESYINEHPEELPYRGGELIIPTRLLNCGEKMKIGLVSYGSDNAALTVTHDCFNPNHDPEQIPLDFVKRGEDYFAEIDVCFDVPGNTRIEYWVNQERIVRQIGVLDKGYMAVIPWVGANRPILDEELHRFDLPGDYWMSTPLSEKDPAEVVKVYQKYIRNSRKYGDRLVYFINGKTIDPAGDSDCLFEMSRELQDKGLRQIKRQMEIMGCDMELVASYTPGHDTLEILEEMGVKGLTSLCSWQNWQDGGWKINHCGVANQPYYPAHDDFRRAGDKRSIMCYTMGNASCSRNYSIMVLDGCPTNIVPGERYLDNRVVNQQLQRFYDVFDGYIQDAKNNDTLLTISIALESFRGFMDWAATNEAAIRYMVKKAGTEKIVFTSAADVTDYHRKHDLNMQSGYFFQPDYYYGYHNGALPGHVDDRIEADTPDYLAVIRRSSMLPMYFYDYTYPWNSELYEDTERNIFGLVNPDEHKPSECYPKQIFTEDMQINSTWEEHTLRIMIQSESKKTRMVTGVFDIPYADDFDVTFDNSQVTYKKIHDIFTGNTHLFLDLGTVEQGSTVITGHFTGKHRKHVNAEVSNGVFAAKYFGEHAYLRSMDRDAGIAVKLPAPNSAYVRLVSGKKIFAADGYLEFSVNTHWADEAPILYNYPRELLMKNLEEIHVRMLGPTSCSRWSWRD